MKNLKKLIVILCAFFLAFTLTGCGPKEEEVVEEVSPLFDENVRLALLWGIDRQAICDARDDGVTRPLYGFVPTGIVADEGDFRVVGGDYCGYDLDKAKEYLAKAGYSTENPLTLEYYYNQNATHDLVAALLKEQLKLVGINLELKTADVRTFFADRDENGAYQLARGAMSADYSDSVTYLDMATFNYQMYISWGDAKYDEMMTTASNQSGQERIDTLHAAEKYLVEETAQVVPLFEYGSACLRGDGVSGDFDNFQGNSIFWFVENEGKDSFTYALGGAPNYLDPAVATDSIGSYTINQMFFPLVYLGPEGIQNAAAESIEVSDDGLTYTIKLVENYWSDGVKVTANDYVYGVKHALSIGSAEASYLSWVTNYVKGAEQYEFATDVDMPELGVVALDDDTLQITLLKPCSFFTSLLWGGVYYPLREDFAPMGDYTWAAEPGYPMNGAYVPTSIDLASKVVFEKNDKWCWADKVKTDTVIAAVMEDMDAQLMAFQNGEIDFATSVDAATVSKMDELANNFFATGVINYYIQLNCYNPDAE